MVMGGLSGRFGVNIRRYSNARGFGINITNRGERYIGLDWHRFKIGGRKIGRFVNRPHLDIPSKGIKHWPWQQIDKWMRGIR